MRPEPNEVTVYSQLIEALIRCAPAAGVTLAVLVASFGVLFAWSIESPILAHVGAGISERSR